MTDTVRYRSKTYDGRAVTGLKHAEIADTPEGGVSFYPTPSASNSVIPQDHTPRRARMRSVVEHLDRWGNVTRFHVIEAMRTESFGPRPTLYGWRAAQAVEIPE